MKALKYVGYGLGGILALLLVGIGLLYALFDPNDYRGELQQVVQQQTGRSLELQGDIRLSVWPRIALEFGPAALGNAPGFDADPMLRVARVRLGVKLRPLLQKRVEVERAELQGPVLRLMVNAAGADNWSSLGAGASNKDAGSAAAPAAVLSIAVLKIADGTLDYIDRKAGSTTTVANLQLQTAVTLDLEQQRYTLANPVIEMLVSGAALPKAGVRARLGFEQLSADLKAQTLSARGLKLEALGATLTGELAGRNIVDDIELSGSLALAAVAPRALLKELGVEPPPTSDAAVLKRLQLQGQLTANSRSLRLAELRAQLDDSTLTGSAGITDLDQMALAFNLAVDRFNLDRYMEPATPAGKTTAGAGAGAASAAVPLPVEWLRGLNLKGTLAVNEAVFSGIHLSKLRLGLEARNSRLRVFPSEAQLYGGQYHGDITLDGSSGVARLGFNEQVTGVEFAPLLKDWFQSNLFSGKGNLSLKAEAHGKDSDSILRALTGSFSLKTDGAALEGKDLWYEIRRANALLRKRAPPERSSGPARTVFTSLAASGSITNGVFNTSDVNAETRGMKVTGGGSIDVPQSHLNMRFNAAIQNAAGADSPDAADIAGFTVPVVVDGALTDPRIRPDIEGLAKAAVQKKVDEKKEELQQKVRDAVQEKLKGLFR